MRCITIGLLLCFLELQSIHAYALTTVSGNRRPLSNFQKIPDKTRDLISDNAFRSRGGALSAVSDENQAFKSRGGAQSTISEEQKDAFKGSSIALFSALLTPSTLLSGAAYGTMFTLKADPLVDTSIMLLERRLFIVLSGATTACALTAVISSAMALFRIRFMPNDAVKTTSLIHGMPYSLKNFIYDNCKPFFMSSFVNFTLAITGFICMVTIRAWHVISCPSLSAGLAMILGGCGVNILGLIERALWSMDGSPEGSRWRLPTHLPALMKDYIKFLSGFSRKPNASASGMGGFQVLSVGLWVGGGMALWKSFRKAIIAM
jgi:hypothetical protein